MMQDRKDMREKNIQPKIYWDEKIENGWNEVANHDLKEVARHKMKRSGTS